MKKKKQVRHPSANVMESISEGLKEIEGYFEGEGFSDSKTHVDLESGVEDQISDEEDVENGIDTVFQREDIEVAIDVFLSDLIAKGLIKKGGSDGQPSFSEIFEKLFGDDHQLTSAARLFEERIEGYFGVIAYDDMNQAYAELSSIRAIMSKEMNNRD